MASTRGRHAAEEQNISMREELQTSMDGKLKGHREPLQADLHQQHLLLEARINYKQDQMEKRMDEVTEQLKKITEMLHRGGGS